MTAKVLVAYRTYGVPSLYPNVNDLNPPANYKNEEAVDKWRAAKAEEIEPVCLRQPYTATFDEVHLANLAHRKSAAFRRNPAAPWPNVAQRAGEWLLKFFPDAWQYSTGQPLGERPPVVFVGFGTRLFLDVLGHDCAGSLPAGKPPVAADDPWPLPPSLWLGAAGHRDLEDVFLPSRYKFSTWDTVLKHYGLRDAFPGWDRPGLSPEVDMKLVAELSAAIGFLNAE